MGSRAYRGDPLGRAVGPVPVLTQAPNGDPNLDENQPVEGPSLLKGRFTENRWVSQGASVMSAD